jgi:RecJ-like exonuclease
MASEAVYQNKCPICGGSGSIEVIQDKYKEASRKQVSTGPRQPCVTCDGTGWVMIRRKIPPVKKGED